MLQTHSVGYTTVLGIYRELGTQTITRESHRTTQEI